MVNVKSLFPFFYRDEPDYRRLSLDEFPRKQREPADNRDKKSRKWKNRNCCYINLHGTCRYSKLFFLFLSFSSNTEGTRRAARGAQLATLLFTSSRNSDRVKMCVSHACMSYQRRDFIKVQLHRCTREKGQRVWVR